jgi:hypothetical protein
MRPRSFDQRESALRPDVPGLSMARTRSSRARATRDLIVPTGHSQLRRLGVGEPQHLGEYERLAPVEVQVADERAQGHTLVHTGDGGLRLGEAGGPLGAAQVLPAGDGLGCRPRRDRHVGGVVEVAAAGAVEGLRTCTASCGRRCRAWSRQGGSARSPAETGERVGAPRRVAPGEAVVVHGGRTIVRLLEQSFYVLTQRCRLRRAVHIRPMSTDVGLIRTRRGKRPRRLIIGGRRRGRSPDGLPEATLARRKGSGDMTP